MKKQYLLLFLLLLPIISLAAPQNLPLEFVENRGQWDGPFVYRASTNACEVFLEKNGFTYLLSDPNNGKNSHALKHGEIQTAIMKYHAYKVQFLGASDPEKITPGKIQPHYYNYYLGSDKSHWQSEIHPAQVLDYTALYAGIDMHLSSESGRIKYDLLVKPGSNASVIQMKYTGADRVLLQDGNLYLMTSVGSIQEMKPYAYQVINDKRVEVPCQYKLKDNVVSFAFPKGYDKSEQLVIDPVIVFASFTGSTADNWGFTATYDNSGNFYAGGAVSGGVTLSYPVTTGAIQDTFAGGGTTAGNSGFPCDIAISKFNATGTTLLYSTYLGGSSNDQPHSMIVDANSNLIIAGRTYSHNFPRTATAYDTSYNGNADMVVVKFNATGTALIGSTFVGGSGDDGVNTSGNWYTGGPLKHNYGDDARSEVNVDKQGNVYVAASTQSTNFPVTSNAFQSVKNGTQDGVVFKLNPTLTTMLWSTFLGGSGDDAAYVLALDSNETHLYVAGGTSSADFPGTGGYWPSYQGGSADGFIVKFYNGGNYPLQRRTYIGQSSYDQCYGVQLDMENNVYAMGQTLGGSFPVSPGVYSNPNSSQFIIKLDSNLTTNVYSTVFGSGTSTNVNISPVAFLVDTCQNVYISGWGGPLPINSSDITNMPVTSDGFQTTTNGKGFYFIVLSKNALSLLYGSYLAAQGTSANEEHVDGGTSRFDKSGVIYQGICGGCGGYSNFPTQPNNVWSKNNQSSNCNFLAVKIAFQLGAVNARINADPSAKGCPPFTVNFRDSSLNATSYLWDFADGSAHDTTKLPTHTFVHPGIYHVRLTIYNPNACKTRDTAYLTITVDSNYVKSNFTSQVVDSCGPFTASFFNTSTYGSTPGSVGFTKFTWLFGDGTSYVGVNPPLHNYPSAGTYTVKLAMVDSTACNAPDTMTQTITIVNTIVKAAWNLPDSVCLGGDMTFNNLSTNAATVLWRFGDGNTSTAGSPVHTYASAGTFTITLIAYNPASCNKADSITKTVKININPTADFSSSPVIPIANTPIQFTNLSTNASIYGWNFGDGNGSIDVNPSHFYKRTGHYQVCLTARNTSGCADTVCKYVDAEIHTAVDIPTGFSPNGDGNNDILYVRGGAIETMNLKIFNRWGEMVFESNSLDSGWDGTYKGKPQEMDAYVYILNVTFVDGTSAQKKGNVTLLR